VALARRNIGLHTKRNAKSTKCYLKCSRSRRKRRKREALHRSLAQPIVQAAMGSSRRIGLKSTGNALIVGT